MRKIITLIILILGGFATMQAQQDAMFTKYMFNSLVYNPAYAGSKEFMSVSLLHRTQWWNIPGGPNTQSFTIHSPLRNERVGLGMSLINDVIGPTHTISANLSYAYRIPVGEKAKLSVGLQGGLVNWRADWSDLTLEEGTDEAFSEEQPTFWLPNFGAGIYFYTDRFYLGAGVPHLVEYDLRKNIDAVPQWARQYRHYFFSAGAAFPLNGDAIVLKPSLLVKSVGLFSGFNKDENYQNVGAPTEFDIDLSVLFYNAFWVGTSFRSSVEAFTDDSSSFDSIDFWAAYYLMNGLRIGAAYDFTLTKLRQPAQGSFEVMLGYEFNYVTKKAATPRYF